MAVRMPLERLAVPVSSMVSLIPPSIRASAAICRSHTLAQSKKLPRYPTLTAELSGSFSTHGRGNRASRCLSFVGKFAGNFLNFESFDCLRKSQARTFVISMSVSPSAAQTSSMEDDEFFKIEEKIICHQKTAAKLDRAVESRTVVDKLSNGILSTISKKWDGVPVPSMVTYAAEESGTILLCISSLSPHTADLEANSKCSFLVAKDLNDRSDVVITIIGEAVDVPEAGIGDAKSTFLKKHPEAFWVDFGDFKMVRVEPKHVRYVSGIVTGTATVAQLSGQEFKAAIVDPVSQFSGPIAHHMNADHADQTRMIVEHSVGISVDSAVITDLDSVGFYVLSQRQRKPLKLRIPFPRRAESRKDVKTLIVEMLAASAPKVK